MVIRRKNVVKNIFDIIFPPKCRGCGRTGMYLCDCCKKYILEKVKLREIDEDEVLEVAGEEKGGKVFFQVGFLGYRDGILGELVEEYKYFSVKGLAKEIAEITKEGIFDRGSGSLSRRVSKNSSAKTSAKRGTTILVPMPTSRKHVRERGFDHMDLLAREIEKRTRGKVKRVRLLERAKDTVQVGADEETRRRQAKEAVRVNPEYLGEDGRIVPEFREAEVVLIDDVWTTGASMTEAGRILKRAGVKRLEGLVITKNRDGKSPLVRRGDLS